MAINQEFSPLLRKGLRWLELQTPDALEDLKHEAAFYPKTSPLARAIQELVELPDAERTYRLRCLLIGYRTEMTPIHPEVNAAMTRLQNGVLNAW